MKKKLLAVLLGVVMVLGVMTISAFAAETTGETYEIGTPEALIALAEEAKKGETFLGDTVNLTANIDMSGYYWYNRSAEGTVVSDYRIPSFAGTFNGNGYTVSNLKFVDECSTATEVVPLAFIVECYNAPVVIQNLNIKGITVNTKAPARFSGLVDHFTAWQYSGDKGSISGVTVSDIVVNSEAQLAFGGLLHKTFGLASSISNCHVKNFTVNANGVLDGENSGRCGGFIATGGEVTKFENCSVDGFSVVATCAERSGKYLGGFIGGASMTASFVNCDVADFSLEASAKFSSVGGFVGYTAGSAWGTDILFDSCDVTGLDISTNGVISVGAGGFIGNLYGQSGHNFVNCTTSGRISGNAYAGGFAGWLYGRASNCSATFTNCNAAVNVLNNGYFAGGFVGNHTPYNNSVCPATYVNCKAWGDVYGVEPVGSTFTGIVGGTYNYDPENVDAATGETNSVAPGYRALDNGDGTWTVFAGTENVVKLVFHKWEDGAFVPFRTVEVFNNTSFVNSAYNNALSSDAYRFGTGLDMFKDQGINNVGKYAGWTTVLAGNVNDFKDDTVVELENEGEILNVYPVMSVTGYNIINTGDSNLTIRMLKKSILGNWIPGDKIIIEPNGYHTVAADGFVGVYIGDSLFSYSMWSSGNIPDFLTAVVDYVSNSFYGEGEFSDGTNSIKVEPVYSVASAAESATTYGFNTPSTFGSTFGWPFRFGFGGW